ncbi:MAG: hypothetical protein GX270_01090, partial [Clostridiaceae bacterium]|nr:hypothetical protein [Clostridiaceae bacterium]
MKKRFMIFALVLTCILACCKTAYALTPAPRIEGTIFLPEGKVAPPGGIKLKVIAEASNSVRTFESMINEGENSTNYWLTVLSDLNNKLTEGESLNIVLEKGNVIRGEIRLPEDEVAGKGGFPV